MKLQGANVVITGASRGIGAALAEDFTKAGANVLLVARSEGALAALAERLGAKYLVADLIADEDVDTLIERSIEALGHVDVLINNAGLDTNDAFVHIDRNDIRQVNRLNLETPMLLTRDVLTHMLARGRGHVVQMSSIAGVLPFPGVSAYGATKAGLTHFNEALRLELAGTGVGLTLVTPGAVDTEMWDRIDTGESYQAPAIKRFKRLFFLPKVKVDKISSATLTAVAEGKPYVRIPKRYGMYHGLENAPRRVVQLALTGVKLGKLRPGGNSAPSAAVDQTEPSPPTTQPQEMGTTS